MRRREFRNLGVGTQHEGRAEAGAAGRERRRTFTLGARPCSSVASHHCMPSMLAQVRRARGAAPCTRAVRCAAGPRSDARAKQPCRDSWRSAAASAAAARSYEVDPVAVFCEVKMARFSVAVIGTVPEPGPPPVIDSPLMSVSLGSW